MKNLENLEEDMNGLTALDRLEHDLVQYSFDRLPVFAKFREEKGKFYINDPTPSLQKAMEDEGTPSVRVNARNVRTIEKYMSVDIGNGYCAILITPEVEKRYAKLSGK
jgi:hypothetical protein